jgi:hypothetical protein
MTRSATCDGAAAPEQIGGFLKNLPALMVSTVFGWIGWVLGSRIGFMTAYFSSGFASILGFYAGWKITRRLLE